MKEPEIVDEFELFNHLFYKLKIKGNPENLYLDVDYGVYFGQEDYEDLLVHGSLPWWYNDWHNI